jgi:hypothetical protein
MEQMQDICRGSVGPLERAEGSATRPSSRCSGKDVACLIGKPRHFVFFSQSRIIGEYDTKRSFFDLKKLTIATGS